MEPRRVPGYPKYEVRQKERLRLETYEYHMPFNYPNVVVWRKQMRGEEFHGVELATRNPASPAARLTRVEPGAWTLMQTSFHVPPRAASVLFLVEVSGMAAEETLWLADPFAGRVFESGPRWRPAHGGDMTVTPVRLLDPSRG